MCSSYRDTHRRQKGNGEGYGASASRPTRPRPTGEGLAAETGSKLAGRVARIPSFPHNLH
jgi:hypothetical protein